MTDKIRELMAQISALQSELQRALHEREHRVFFELQGKKVHFEKSVRTAHRKLRMGLLRWLLHSRPQSILSLPFIYGMALPMVLMDFSVTLYQWVCFPLYGIARVKRSDYFVFDRVHLSYLNLVEKLNCMYCSYGNALFAYGSEIAARTEQYWCPIKHARKAVATHQHYEAFAEYGDGESYEAQLRALRDELAEEKRKNRTSE